MSELITTATLQPVQTDPQGDSPIAAAFFEQKIVIAHQ
jgi:hypothetical protein